MTEAEIPPFKDQCLKWHNVYREKHQVNNNRIDFSLRVNCISMQVAVIVSMNQLHDPPKTHRDINHTGSLETSRGASELL